LAQSIELVPITGIEGRNRIQSPKSRVLNKNRTIDNVQKHNFCSKGAIQSAMVIRHYPEEGRQLSNVRREYNTYPGMKEVEISALETITISGDSD
jgi:hypothetical protein